MTQNGAAVPLFRFAYMFTDISGGSASGKSAEQLKQELPLEPRKAPRPGEQEQIVYLNLSELFAFKDQPFQVRNDEEMAAMVVSVKDKGVTQPARGIRAGW